MCGFSHFSNIKCENLHIFLTYGTFEGFLRVEAIG